MERGKHVGPVGRRGHAELQGPGDGVRRGLVDVDRHRRRHRLRTAGFRDDVQILPAEHLGADRRRGPPHPPVRIERQIRGRHDVVGPHQCEVAEQDGRRYPELVR